MLLLVCAQELDLPILKVAAPEIVSGVSGESEQKLRDLFEQAVVSQLKANVRFSDVTSFL